MFSKLLKPLLWLLALCLAVYICICSYMFAQQRQMIFPGGGTQVAAESTDFSLQRADVLLRGWQLHPADGKARTPGEALFADALQRCCGGARDARTLELLDRA